MKRYFVLMLLLMLCGCGKRKDENASAENAVGGRGLKEVTATRGYKDLRWGDPVDTVRRKFGPLREGHDDWRAFQYAYVYQHVVTEDSGHTIFRGKVRTYTSLDGTISLGFYSGKLFHVTVYFEDPANRILGELESKHGTVPPLGRGGYYDLRAWFNDPGRVIVYDYDRMGFKAIVRYLDANVYDEYVTKNQGTPLERIAKEEATRNKID